MYTHIHICIYIYIYNIIQHHTTTVHRGDITIPSIFSTVPSRRKGSPWMPSVWRCSSAPMLAHAPGSANAWRSWACGVLARGKCAKSRKLGLRPPETGWWWLEPWNFMTFHILWWLEPWNFMTFPSCWECHHPNWRSIPPTRKWCISWDSGW